MILNNGKYTIEESDIIHPELFNCPSCNADVYATLAVESKDLLLKSTKNLSPFTLVGRCKCGHEWLEELTPSHHRSHIRGFWMVNYGKYES